MTDQEIISAIRKGNREKSIVFLYEEFPKIERLIINSGCNKSDAREIFNDSLILLIEKVESPNFVLTSKLTTYLYGINRIMAKNNLKKHNKPHELEWKDALNLDEGDLDYDVEYETKLKSIELLLTKISLKCRKIFQLFYFEKKSMQAIADELGYSSMNSAKTQKFKCIEQAFKLSQQNQSIQH
ncbi:MAG: RNA polymerase sigma factor (sigma-70 family) [Crocinitomicaceae bacterium]|jgi:RNA polymerase sigma factor (sigma-70 family)